MAVSLIKSGTEYVANEITLLRGVPADILTVKVYHTTNPAYIPILTDFITVTYVNGTGPLNEDGKLDILSLIGTKVGAHFALSTPGDYQRWALIQTASEDIIRRLDTIEVE